MRATDLRPEVLAFAFAMEETLREHDAKKGALGWKTIPGIVLARGAIAEAKELYFEFQGTLSPRAARVLSEAADTGNFAMMTADVMGALPLASAQAELRRLAFYEDQEARADEESTFDGDIVAARLGGTD